jgi:hypothetical protein
VTVKISPLIGVLLVIVAASGLATTILAVVDGTATGDWLDANAAVGYPALGFVLLAMAGLGVLVFLAALAIFIALLVTRSRTADSRV